MVLLCVTSCLYPVCNLRRHCAVIGTLCPSDRRLSASSGTISRLFMRLYAYLTLHSCFKNENIKIRFKTPNRNVSRIAKVRRAHILIAILYPYGMFVFNFTRSLQIWIAKLVAMSLVEPSGSIYEETAVLRYRLFNVVSLSVGTWERCLGAGLHRKKSGRSGGTDTQAPADTVSDPR